MFKLKLYHYTHVITLLTTLKQVSLLRTPHARARTHTLGWSNSSCGFFHMMGFSCAYLSLLVHSRQVCEVALWHLSYQRTFKKWSKLVNFCVAILILKMEENKQHFGLLCFIISRRAKMQLKRRKRCVRCMEKVPWVLEPVRSGLQSFVLEIPLWMMLHGQVDQWKLIANKVRL